MFTSFEKSAKNVHSTVHMEKHLLGGAKALVAPTMLCAVLLAAPSFRRTNTLYEQHRIFFFFLFKGLVARCLSFNLFLH
jgi:hypothetical protein